MIFCSHMDEELFSSVVLFGKFLIEVTEKNFNILIDKIKDLNDDKNINQQNIFLFIIKHIEMFFKYKGNNITFNNIDYNRLINCFENRRIK